MENRRENPRESSWYLLRNIANAKIWRTPYPVLCIPNALPQAEYETLCDLFPNIVPECPSFQVTTIHKIMDLEHDFVRANRSPEFLEDILQALQFHFVERPNQEVYIRPQWTIQYCKDMLDYKVRELHIDKRNKLFNSFLYIPDKNDTFGGDFQIFMPRIGQVPIFDANHRVVNTFAMEHVDTIPYQPNTFFAFLNDPWSIHRVGLRKGSNIPRRSINIVAEWKDKETNEM